MLLEVDDSKKIGDLQERFSLCFPSLKLEFCRKKHGWEDTCEEPEFFGSEVPVMKIRKKHDPGILEIKSWNKVGEVEKDFYRKFGLSVQIFYKCRDMWIQTGKADNVTLAFLQEKACV